MHYIETNWTFIRDQNCHRLWKYDNSKWDVSEWDATRVAYHSYYKCL